jgi:plastocyanin
MGRAPLTTRVLGLAACATLVGGLSACSNDKVAKNVDLVAGKKAFVKSCGACHTLAHAGTKGTVGPNLDDAFRESLSEGFGRNTVMGVVREQIDHPARLPKTSPVFMPQKVVTGQTAQDVASYVASVVAVPGQDTGRLASAVPAAGSGKPVAASGGKLEMPADPNGQLAYASKQATAPAGKLEIDSKNASSTPHDIVITGNGVNQSGKTVSNGGVSTISVNLKPGKYAYFCSLPGHRAAGMQGTLTVK